MRRQGDASGRGPIARRQGQTGHRARSRRGHHRLGPDAGTHSGVHHNGPIDEILYFAYGSNLHLPQLRRRAPSAVPLGPGKLPGRRLAFTRASTRWDGLAADIVPDPAASVWGAVISLKRGHLQALDRSEYLGIGYRRIPVEPLVDSRPHRAFTYEVIDRQPEGAPPRAYLATMVAGARELGLPRHWIGFLESFG